jgi:protein-S-isoprenylcysteine O-methyltransferase Ste14
LAFLAEVLGAMLGTMMDPLWWGLAFALTMIPRGQPWTALSLAVAAGLTWFAVSGREFSMALLPVTIGVVSAFVALVALMFAARRFKKKRAESRAARPSVRPTGEV